jgi:hypothetical protein
MALLTKYNKYYKIIKYTIENNSLIVETAVYKDKETRDFIKVNQVYIDNFLKKAEIFLQELENDVDNQQDLSIEDTIKINREYLMLRNFFNGRIEEIEYPINQVWYNLGFNKNLENYRNFVTKVKFSFADIKEKELNIEEVYSLIKANMIESKDC